MIARNFQCPETEEPCAKVGCKVGHCIIAEPVPIAPPVPSDELAKIRNRISRAPAAPLPLELPEIDEALLAAKKKRARQLLLAAGLTGDIPGCPEAQNPNSIMRRTVGRSISAKRRKLCNRQARGFHCEVCRPYLHV